MFEAVNIKHQLISNDCSYLVNWGSGVSLSNCLRLLWHTNTKILGWFKGVQHFYSLTSLQLLTCTKQFGSTLTCDWSAKNQQAVRLRRAAGGRSGKAESENLKQSQKFGQGREGRSDGRNSVSHRTWSRNPEQVSASFINPSSTAGKRLSCCKQDFYRNQRSGTGLVWPSGWPSRDIMFLNGLGTIYVQPLGEPERVNVL